jgi:uncharacterized protein YycO
MEKNTEKPITRNPYYDNLEIYTLDQKSLRRGDILLTRNKNSRKKSKIIQSTIISSFSKGDYSHALIASIPPIFVEAIQEGVSNLSSANCFSHSLDNVMILRYNDEGISSKAASIAMKYIGLEYSIKKAIASIFSISEDFFSEGTFCSHLVALCYKEAGSIDFDNIDITKITPASLQKMTCFHNATDLCFKKILSPENIEHMTALDGDRIKSPLIQQASIYNEIYNKIEYDIDDFLNINFSLKKQKPDTFLKLISLLPEYYINSQGTNNTYMIDKFEKLDMNLAKLIAESKLKDITSKAVLLGHQQLEYIKNQSMIENGDIAIDDVIEMNSYGKEQYIERKFSYDSIFPYADKIKSIYYYIKIQDIVLKISKERVDIAKEIINSGKIYSKR